MKKSFAALGLMGLAGFAAASPPGWAQQIQDRLPGLYGGLEAWQWIGLAALLAIGIVVHAAARFAARRLVRLRDRVSGTSTGSGERSICRGAGLIGYVVPWYLSLEVLELPPSLDAKVHIIVDAITVIGVMLLVYGVWDAVCDALAQRAGGVANAEKLLIPVTRKLVRFIILIAGFMLALGVFGVNITGLLAGVGIGGLVVALAAKDSVENVFGSLTILFDMPFALGDWVKIDKYEGIVEEINLRSTRIRTFEDSMITLPNSNLIKAAVENYGARRYRRQRFQIRVSYANNARDLEQFMAAVRDYLAKMPSIVEGRSVVELNEMTEVSVGILVQCFFEAASFQEEAKLRSELLLAIFKAQEATGVIFIGTPIPAPEEEPHPMSKEMRKLITDKEDII